MSDQPATSNSGHTDAVAPSNPEQGKTAEKTFTQSDLDRIVAERLARESVKKDELESLRQFKEEQEKLKETQTQQELEAQKKYEEALNLKDSKIKEYETVLSSKDQAIQDMTIGNAVTSEVMKQGLYPEAVQLLKAQTVIKDGKVLINGRNADGIETELTLEEGIKRFAQDKPYLVKAQNQGGAGTASQTAGTTPNTSPMSRADALATAMRTGDRATVAKLKQEIRAGQTA